MVCALACAGGLCVGLSLFLAALVGYTRFGQSPDGDFDAAHDRGVAGALAVTLVMGAAMFTPLLFYAIVQFEHGEVFLARKLGLRTRYSTAMKGGVGTHLILNTTGMAIYGLVVGLVFEPFSRGEWAALLALVALGFCLMQGDMTAKDHNALLAHGSDLPFDAGWAMPVSAPPALGEKKAG